MSRGRFVADEPEFDRLQEWVSSGDWVIDAGAHVGHYTLRMSALVGPEGRVLAFEPVPETFELLAANALHAPHRNLTLFNVAVSDRSGSASMIVPSADSDPEAFYFAKVVDKDGDFVVFTLAVDSLALKSRVGFVKIDVEGHELAVLQGMEALVKRDGPVILVEGDSPAVESWLRIRGYGALALPGSPNRLFERAG